MIYLCYHTYCIKLNLINFTWLINWLIYQKGHYIFDLSKITSCKSVEPTQKIRNLYLKKGCEGAYKFLKFFQWSCWKNDGGSGVMEYVPWESVREWREESVCCVNRKRKRRRVEDLSWLAKEGEIWVIFVWWECEWGRWAHLSQKNKKIKKLGHYTPTTPYFPTTQIS